MTKYFNFNNEANTIPFEEENGQILVKLNGNNLTFPSVAALAEQYALARDVHADDLKRWVLVENGDTFSFVLRAATGGLYEDFESIRDDVIGYLDNDDDLVDRLFSVDWDTELVDPICMEENQILFFLSLYPELVDEFRDQYAVDEDDFEEDPEEEYDEDYEEDFEEDPKPVVEDFFLMPIDLERDLQAIEDGTFETNRRLLNEQIAIATFADRDHLHVLAINPKTKAFCHQTRTIHDVENGLASVYDGRFTQHIIVLYDCEVEETPEAGDNEDEDAMRERLRQERDARLNYYH